MLTQEQVAQAIIITNIIEWDKTIIICCPRMDMAAAVLDRIYQLHDTLPDWIKHKLVYRQKRSAQFENGTRIILASDPCHLRGLAVSRAYIHDELRQLPNFEEWRTVFATCMWTRDEDPVVFS